MTKHGKKIKAAPEHNQLEVMKSRVVLKLHVCVALLESINRSGHTLRYVAEQVGLSEDHLTDLLMGGGDMTLELISDISHACGVELRFTLYMRGA